MTRRFRNSIKALPYVFALLLINACSRPVEIWTRSYVQAYAQINGIEFRQYISLKNGEFEFIGSSVVGSILDKRGKNRKWYDSVCERNQDISYNRIVTLYTNNAVSIVGLYPDIESVEVRCLSAYDSAHAPGSLLNDYIYFGYKSAWPYISGAYTGEEPESAELSWKLLSDVRPEDLKVIIPRCFLRFEKLPEKLLSHPMTISVRLSDGTVYKEEFRYDFSTMTIYPQAW